MKIHLFNPENDLALASGLECFTPPKGAVAISHAGALLPMFWAEKDDHILSDIAPSPEMEQYIRRYRLQGTAVSHTEACASPSPWGWSLYSRRIFRKAGVDEGLLPDNDTLEKIRLLSHRRSSIIINRGLGVSEHLIPVEASSPEEVREALARFAGKGVIKLPWSSSGRGVIRADQIADQRLDAYVGGMISRQGSVMVEPLLDRRRDFAALFHCANSTVRYRGLSLFATNHAGFYEGNIVLPQRELAAELGVDISHIIKPLEQILSELVGNTYEGWLGIDMMIHSDGNGRLQIAPCIELNLRMTMGVAAMLAAEKAFAVERVRPMLIKVSPEGVTLR